MRPYCYLLFSLFLLPLSASAQLILGPETYFTPGNRYALPPSFNVIVPADADLLPAAGENQIYDYTALGDLIDEDFGVTLRELSADSSTIVTVTSDPGPLADTIFADLPPSSVTVLITLPPDDEDEEPISLGETYIQNDTGIFIVAESFLSFSEGNDFDLSPEPEIYLPYGLEPGDTASFRTTEIERDTLQDFVDSTILTQSFTYHGSGSLSTFFGDFDQVAVLREYLDLTFFSAESLDAPLELSSIQRAVSYTFFQPGDAVPVLTVNFSVTGNNDSFSTDGINLSYSRPLASDTTVSTSALPELTELTLFPNPTTGAVNVAFDLPVAGTVTTELYDPFGRSVLRRSFPGRPSGSNQLRLALPDQLPAGNYLLRTGSATHASVRPLIIR